MNLAVAFLSGVLTFFTPCIFPLIPSYLSFITGSSVEELSKGDKKQLLNRSAFGSLCFILGFSIIFVLLGFSASIAGSLIMEFQNYLRVIGGVIVVIFGLTLTGLLDIKALQIERKINIKGKPAGYGGAFLLGMTFSAGWVPCVGPILSSILIMASTAGSRFYGGTLLLSYSFGLGLPIFISAVAFNLFLSAYRNISRHLRTISIISGIILVIMGALLITDSLIAVSSYISLLFGFKGM